MFLIDDSFVVCLQNDVFVGRSFRCGAVFVSRDFFHVNNDFFVIFSRHCFRKSDVDLAIFINCDNCACHNNWVAATCRNNSDSCNIFFASAAVGDGRIACGAFSCVFVRRKFCLTSLRVSPLWTACSVIVSHCDLLVCGVSRFSRWVFLSDSHFNDVFRIVGSIRHFHADFAILINNNCCAFNLCYVGSVNRLHLNNKLFSGCFVENSRLNFTFAIAFGNACVSIENRVAFAVSFLCGNFVTVRVFQRDVCACHIVAVGILHVDDDFLIFLREAFRQLHANIAVFVDDDNCVFDLVSVSVFIDISNSDCELVGSGRFNDRRRSVFPSCCLVARENCVAVVVCALRVNFVAVASVERHFLSLNWCFSHSSRFVGRHTFNVDNNFFVNIRWHVGRQIDCELAFCVNNNNCIFDFLRFAIFVNVGDSCLELVCRARLNNVCRASAVGRPDVSRERRVAFFVGLLRAIARCAVVVCHLDVAVFNNVAIGICDVNNNFLEILREIFRKLHGNLASCFVDNDSRFRHFLRNAVLVNVCNNNCYLFVEDWVAHLCFAICVGFALKSREESVAFRIGGFWPVGLVFSVNHGDFFARNAVTALFRNVDCDVFANRVCVVHCDSDVSSFFVGFDSVVCHSDSLTVVINIGDSCDNFFASLGIGRVRCARFIRRSVIAWV